MTTLDDTHNGRSPAQRAFLWLAAPAVHRSPANRYAFALAVAVAFTLIAVLVERTTNSVVLVLPLLAVILATMYGGLGPGVLSLAITALCTIYFAMHPLYSFRIRETGDIVRLATFLPSALLVGIIYDAAHRAERRASRLADELGRALASRDEFVSLVSHQLKSPLTVVLGNAAVLARRTRLDAELRTAAQDIAEEAEHLRRLVDDLLVLARLDAGALLPCEPIVFRHLLREVVERHARRYPDRRVDVITTADIPPVAAAAPYLEQVLANLLSNAEKYSPPDTPIEVRLGRLGAEVLVAVQDRGAGIPAADLEKVFEPFYRSPSAAGVAGIGVGLAVCRRLVEAQSGRIWARPRVGGGTEVAFTLPVAGADELAEEMAEAMAAVTGEETAKSAPQPTAGECVRRESSSFDAA